MFRTRTVSLASSIFMGGGGIGISLVSSRLGSCRSLIVGSVVRSLESELPLLFLVEALRLRYLLCHAYIDNFSNSGVDQS